MYKELRRAFQIDVGILSDRMSQISLGFAGARVDQPGVSKKRI